MAPPSDARNRRSRQSRIQPVPRAATTSGSSADMGGYDENLALIRRTKKKEKEKQRKQRRGEARRERAAYKPAGVAQDELRPGSNTQPADPAAVATRTPEDAVTPSPDEDKYASAQSRATLLLLKKPTKKAVTDEARGQPHKPEETAVRGVVAELMSQGAVSVAKPVSHVAVSVVAGEEEVNKPVEQLALEVVVTVVAAAPSASSAGATETTVGGDNADKQNITREGLSRHLAAAEGLDEGEPVTAAGAVEAAAANAAVAVAAAAAAEAKTAEVEKEAIERDGLGSRLLKAATENINDRVEEAAATKAQTTNICTLSELLFSSKANGGDDGGSHDSGSTYMGDSSISTCEDSDCSIATDEEEDQQGLSSPSPGDVAVPCNMQTAQHTRYMGNAGGAYYPMQGSPMQQQQQGILPWVNEGYSPGAYQTPMQYVPQQHMSMSYGKHVDMARPMPVQPMMQYQQTSGGAYLQNIGGTYYPVATQPMKKSECVYDQNYVGTCSTLTPSYTQPPAMGCGGNITGSCPLPAPSYMQPTQEFESCGNVSGVSTASVVPPAEKYPRTFSYGGRTYPYWMSDLGHPLSTPS